VHEVYGDTLASETSRTPCNGQLINAALGSQVSGDQRTDSMDVRFHIWPLICAPVSLIHEWEVIINHHVNLKNIDSPGNHIRRNEDLKIDYLTRAQNAKLLLGSPCLVLHGSYR
jgi:hypothetical protein